MKKQFLLLAALCLPALVFLLMPEQAYAADEDFVSKLVQEFYKPEIGILPIGDRFTMGADQAAYACRNFFDFKTVIPCHYASFKGFVDPDATKFLAAMGPDAGKVKVMSAGESLEV